MIFQNKVDRAMKWLTDKNQANEVHGQEESDVPFDARAEWLAEQEAEGMKFEKGDLTAIFLSALLVFGPVLLVLLSIGFIAYFLVFGN